MPRTKAKKSTTRKRGGAPSKLTPERTARICQNVADGMTYRNAALAAGISKTTFFMWKAAGIEAENEGRSNNYRDFVESLKKANAVAEKNAITAVEFRRFPSRPALVGACMPLRTMLSQLIGLTGARRSAGGMVRSLVFAFPVVPLVPRNHTWFDAANNRGLAPRTASHFALRAFREVGNPSRRQGLVGSVYSPSLAEATVYGCTFLLATPDWETPARRQRI